MALYRHGFKRLHAVLIALAIVVLINLLVEYLDGIF